MESCGGTDDQNCDEASIRLTNISAPIFTGIIVKRDFPFDFYRLVSHKSF
jgi:hypothetical protein